MDFKKIGAIGILCTLVIGLASEARLQIADNHIKSIRLEERLRSTKEILLEVKRDVKMIKSHLLKKD